MSNTESKATVYFPSFSTLLGILFITLKLCNVIDWSWWWVLLPIWGPIAFALVIAIIIALIYVGYKICSRMGK